jgi:hypothetical protein
MHFSFFLIKDAMKAELPVGIERNPCCHCFNHVKLWNILMTMDEQKFHSNDVELRQIIMLENLLVFRLHKLKIINI